MSLVRLLLQPFLQNTVILYNIWHFFKLSSSLRIILFEVPEMGHNNRYVIARVLVSFSLI